METITTPDDASFTGLELLKAPKRALRASSKPDSEFLELGLIMDCTGSMSSWIQRAKETLTEIIEQIEKDCLQGDDGNPITVRVAFIGYRDITTTAGRFVMKPFTENIQSMKQFIATVAAAGGEDAPEDVQGGLKMALMQDWTDDATKKVFMITDAPPHGEKYHTMGAGGDHYPAGSPDGLILEDLMKEFKEKDIDFNVIKLDASCDEMIKVMQECHDEVEVKDMSDQMPRGFRPPAPAFGGPAPGMAMAPPAGGLAAFGPVPSFGSADRGMMPMPGGSAAPMMMGSACPPPMMAMAAPMAPPPMMMKESAADLNEDFRSYMAKSSVASVSKKRAMRKGI